MMSSEVSSRAPQNDWMALGLAGTSRVLTLSFRGTIPYFPSGQRFTSCELLDSTAQLDSPDSNYDFVFITEGLGRLRPEMREVLLAEATRVTKTGGIVKALELTSDDAQAVLSLAESYRIDTEDFTSRRLSDRDVSRLEPDTVHYFENTINMPNKQRLLSTMSGMGLEASLENMWTVKDVFPVQRVRVGLSWSIER